jgi:hypothetical protein
MPKKTTKNQEYAPKDLMDELFGGEDLPIDGMEEVYTIDTDLIAKESNIMATSLISSVLRLYNNKDFVDEHPDFKKRIDTEIESLKRMYKMIKTDEIVHDHLVQAISKNPGNASLYMSMTKLQEKISSLDGDIKRILDGLNKICANYQMELNFEQTRKAAEDESSYDETGVVTRGNKAFVDLMNADLDEDDDEFDEADMEG